MAIYQCIFDLVKPSGSFDVTILSFHNLEQTLPKTKSWCSELLLYGDLDGTCVSLFVFDGVVEEITVKIDVSRLFKDSILAIVAFAKENNLVIIENDRYIEATMSNIMDMIRSSDALSFLTDSAGFLSGIKKIEDEF